MSDNELDLEAIKARCEAATEGPWEYDYRTDYIWQWSADGSVRSGAIADVAYAAGNNHQNGEFLTNAREDIPALLAEVGRLREERRWIPVSESKPSGQSVLIVDACGNMTIDWCPLPDYDQRWLGTAATGNYTHWMPLPEPPAAQP